MTEPVKNSPAAIEAERRAKASLGREIITTGAPVFDFQYGVDLGSAEALAKRLHTTREASEAHLAASLYILNNRRAWTEAGYDSFREYAEVRLGIDGSRAVALSSHWEVFMEVGLSPVALGGISWSKFRDLIPAIKAGTVTCDNIEEWVPLIATKGTYALTHDALRRKVSAETAAKKALEGPDDKARISIEVDAADRSDIVNTLNTLSEATGVRAAGDIIKNALDRHLTHIVSDTGDLGVNTSLSNIKRIGEEMAPGVKIIFIAPENGPGYTEQDLGVVPFTRVYTPKDPKIRKFALAVSEESARDILGVDEVEWHPLLMSGDDDSGPDDGPGDLPPPVDPVLDDNGDWEVVDDDDEPIQQAPPLDIQKAKELPAGDWVELNTIPTQNVSALCFKVAPAPPVNPVAGPPLDYEATGGIPSTKASKQERSAYLAEVAQLLPELPEDIEDYVELKCLLELPEPPRMFMDPTKYTEFGALANNAREEAERLDYARRKRLWSTTVVKALTVQSYMAPAIPMSDRDAKVISKKVAAILAADKSTLTVLCQLK